MWHEKDIIQPLIALVNSLTPTITRHIEFINARKFSNILVYSLTHRLGENKKIGYKNDQVSHLIGRNINAEKVAHENSRFLPELKSR